MSKSRKLFTLFVISASLAIVVVVLAWVGGNLRTVILYIVITSISLIRAWKYRRRREANGTSHITKRTPFIKRIEKRLVVWERPFWLFILTASVVLVVIAVFRSNPLYVILEGVWLIVLSGGILLCGGLFER